MRQGQASSQMKTRSVRLARAPGSRLPAGEHLHVVGQELFRDVLIRERHRADRFEESFVLVLFSFGNAVGRQSQWRAFVDALGPLTRDTDVVGWFEEDSILGLIRPL